MFEKKITKSVYDWLDEYGDSHQNYYNEVIHWICVPLIIFSVLCLLWIIPTPKLFEHFYVTINWCILFIAISLIYYLLLSVKLAIAISAFAFFLTYLIYLIEQSDLSLYLVSIGMFVVGWIGQFIGHLIEGKRPSFAQDLQFLMIGPIWLIASLYRRLNISF